MTDIDLIVLLSKERLELQNQIAELKKSVDMYAKWWQDSQKEIQQLQMKINDNGNENN
jgi:hypothetical protein